MAHKQKSGSLWIVEGIGALSNGERRKMKFIVLATNEIDAIKKIVSLTNEYVLFNDDTKTELKWIMELTTAKEHSRNLYCIEGIERQ